MKNNNKPQGDELLQEEINTPSETDENIEVVPEVEAKHRLTPIWMLPKRKRSLKRKECAVTPENCVMGAWQRH